MVVILIGTRQGHEFDLLRDAIRGEGSDVVVVDVDDWPSRKPLTQNVADGTVRIGDETIPVADV